MKPAHALALSAVAIVVLGGCVTDPVKPEVRTITNTVLVPTPIPCLQASDIPAVPVPTPVDSVNATSDQLAAAAAADLIAQDLYIRQADPLLRQCSKLPEIKP